jgi:hypothetical protein
LTTRQHAALIASPSSNAITPGGPSGQSNNNSSNNPNNAGSSASSLPASSSASYNTSAQITTLLALNKQQEDKILKLQEDLTQSYRLNSENSLTFLRLKEQAEKDEKQLLKQQEENAEMKKTVELLQAEREDEKKATALRVKNMESTVTMLREELQSAKVSVSNIILVVNLYVISGNTTAHFYLSLIFLLLSFS